MKTDIISEKRCQSASGSETCKETSRPSSWAHLSDNRGFTLIEVLIAIVVLSLGIFAMGKLQSTAIDGDFKADKLTIASSMAANEAERLLSLDITHDDLKKGVHEPDDEDCGQFCIGWRVIDNVPFPAITADTDGTEFTENDGTLVQTKTIEIVVFDDVARFESSAKERVKIQTIKPRCL